MTSREGLCAAFLARAGWGDADRAFLAGDASARSYDRLRRGNQTAVLMDAPPDQGEDTGAFVRIARHLIGLGLSAPRILAEDTRNGFLLIEDLGDALFARLAEDTPAMIPDLYAAATDVLVHLQTQPAPPGLPCLGNTDWARATAFVLDWYRFAITGERIDTSAFCAEIEALLTSHADAPKAILLRDYHAENLLWLPNREGLARVGILDFQLAQMGQPGYDLVSLLQDARRDVAPETEVAMIRRFLDATGGNAETFSTAYAVLGAQRALRIIGIFARLSLHSGKPSYVNKIPRVWGQLQRNLAHPALAGLARTCDRLLPPPTPENLVMIGKKCGTIPTP